MSDSGIFSRKITDNIWIDDKYDTKQISVINSNNNLTIEPLYAVQGQMVTATLHLDEMQLLVLDDVHIKSRLINALAIELLSAKCIEFTKQQDIATNTTVVRARIFATPDTQVRIIREVTK